MADEFAGIELGPKMLACSEIERRFVWFYVTSDTDAGNATEAARKAGYSENSYGSLRHHAHVVLHRERVLEAIDEVGRRELRSLLAPALRAVKGMLNKAEHSDHSKVVLSTLSRLGFVERSGVDVNVTGAIEHNHTDQAIADLRAMKEMGMNREGLIAFFGFSGLARYEKMLAEADARKPVLQLEAVNADRDSGAGVRPREAGPDQDTAAGPTAGEAARGQDGERRVFHRDKRKRGKPAGGLKPEGNGVHRQADAGGDGGSDHGGPAEV